HEPTRDSDSVTAVLSRLMQAGLWHGDADKDSLSTPERTMPFSTEEDAVPPSADLAPHSPVFDEPTSTPEDYFGASDAAEEDDEALGHTMDVSSLMEHGLGSPRSWRAELLGQEEEMPAEAPVAEAAA